MESSRKKHQSPGALRLSLQGGRHRFSRGRGRLLFSLLRWRNYCPRVLGVLATWLALPTWPLVAGVGEIASRNAPTRDATPPVGLHKANPRFAHANHYSLQNLAIQCALSTSFRVGFCSLCVARFNLVYYYRFEEIHFQLPIWTRQNASGVSHPRRQVNIRFVCFGYFFDRCRKWSTQDRYLSRSIGFSKSVLFFCVSLNAQ